MIGCDKRVYKGWKMPAFRGADVSLYRIKHSADLTRFPFLFSK